MRKTICFVLTVVLLISIISLAAGAGTKPRVEVSGIYEYIINKDKTVSFAGYHEKDTFKTERMSIKSFTVPEKIDGYTVTGIYDYAFSYWRSLSEVILPETITSIGEGAFNNCMSLTTLVLPAGVKKIDKQAFMASSIKNVIVVKGSYAEKCCKKNKISYSYLELGSEAKDHNPEATGPTEGSTGKTETGDKTGEKQKATQTTVEKTQAWYDYGVGMLLPKPLLQSGKEPEISSDTFTNNRVGFYAIVTNAEAADLDTYIALLKQYGFDIIDRSNIHAEAMHSKGYKLYVLFNEGVGLEINSISWDP